MRLWILYDSSFNHNRPCFFVRSKNRQVRQALKNLALKEEALGPAVHDALKVRNTLPDDQIAKSKIATKNQKKVLKESFSTNDLNQSPFVMAKAKNDDGKLADYSSSLCLWDTGEQMSSISMGLLPPDFLELDIHDAYRIKNRVGVQVDAIFSFTNSSFSISTIFAVLPLAAILN